MSVEQVAQLEREVADLKRNNRSNGTYSGYNSGYNNRQVPTGGAPAGVAKKLGFTCRDW